jgi:hypothetical protein
MDNGVSFQQWKNGFPSVSTFDLAIQEREADLAIATFGRALWILDDIRPLRKLAANKGIITNNLVVFKSQDAYQANYRPAPGYEWSVAGIYDAENRKRGAAISYSVIKFPEGAKKATAEEKSTDPASAPAGGGGGGRRGRGMGSGSGSSSKDSVLVQIYNEQQELIRTMKWASDTGFNRNYWGMEAKGYRQPGSPKPKAGSPEPGGLSVLPGTYKVVITVGNDADSTFIVVKADPRVKIDLAAEKAQRTLLKQIEGISAPLTNALDRLSDASDVLTKMSAYLQNMESKDADSLRKTTKKLQDAIKEIREFVNGKTSDKQGIVRFPESTVMSLLQTASMYIQAKSVAPSAQEVKMVEVAESKVKEAVAQTNKFFDENWKAYRKQVESTNLSLFKD